MTIVAQRRIYRQMTTFSSTNMSTTFGVLCNQLKLYIQKTITKYCMPVSVDKQIAVTIWHFVISTKYRTISALFGIGISTVLFVTLHVLSHNISYLCIFKCPVKKGSEKLYKSLKSCGVFHRLLEQLTATTFPF